MIDKKRADKEKEVRIVGNQMREEMEKEEVEGGGNYAKAQPPRPTIDESFLNLRVEQFWEYRETNGKIVGMWCKGRVVGVMRGNQVHIEWDKEYLRPGDLKITQEKFYLTKWNKEVQSGWKMDMDVDDEGDDILEGEDHLSDMDEWD